MSDTKKMEDPIPSPAQEHRSPDGAERRRYFRIEDRVILKYQALAPVDADSLVARLQYDHPSRHQIANTFADTSQQMQYLLRKIEETEPDIAECLDTLNQKLDLLARQLSLEASQMENEPVRWANVSAAGICFEAEDAISPGSVLELNLLLLPSYARISAVGEVVRCEENTADEPGLPFRVAADFVYLPETDRELLVQHVVKRETQLLRQQRGDESDD